MKIAIIVLLIVMAVFMIGYMAAARFWRTSQDEKLQDHLIELYMKEDRVGPEEAAKKVAEGYRIMYKIKETLYFLMMMCALAVIVLTAIWIGITVQ